MSRAYVLITYCVFLGFVCLSLLLKVGPAPIAVDFAVLSSGYANLLIGLGGLSITVLAVLLGLEALDAGRASETRTEAHYAAVRHIGISLAIASITCFVSANMLSEVNALSAAVERQKIAVKDEMTVGMRASGLAEARIAHAQLEWSHAGELDARPVSRAYAGFALDNPPHVEQVLNASVRRHFILAGVSAYFASFLILQSLGFLLLIRFPKDRKVHKLQNIGVLGIGGVLLVKLVWTASFGLSGAAFYGSRALFAAVLVIVSIAYALATRRSVATLGAAKDPDRFGRYVPMLPYYVCLVVTILSMLVLAATFDNYGPPTNADRAIAILGPALVTALLLVIQLERPTIELLVRSSE